MPLDQQTKIDQGKKMLRGTVFAFARQARERRRLGMQKHDVGIPIWENVRIHLNILFAAKHVLLPLNLLLPLNVLLPLKFITARICYRSKKASAHLLLPTAVFCLRAFDGGRGHP